MLSFLASCTKPLPALAVHDELNRQGERIGLSTVYRALHALCDAGLLHSFDTAGERAYRRCVAGAHQHLICEVCGHVMECPPDIAADWARNLRDRTGFALNGKPVDLHGMCGRCQPTADG